MLSPAHDLAQLLHLSALFVSAQFGIAHDVDEKNVGDFQSEFRFLFVRHRGMNLGGSGKALYINFLTEERVTRSAWLDLNHARVLRGIGYIEKQMDGETIAQFIE